MGLFRKIFGGSKQESTTENQAYGDISNAFAPLFGLAPEGIAGFNQLLGGDTTGFDQYKKAVGFDPLAEYGSRGITGNRAAQGMLRAGGTSKDLTEFGNMIQSQFADKYMENLLRKAMLGFGAGELVTSAGSRSDSIGKSTPGIAGFLGSILGGGAKGK